MAELVGDVGHALGECVFAVVQEGAQEPYGAELDGVAELRPRAPAGHRPPPRVAVEEEVAGQLSVVRYLRERTVVAVRCSSVRNACVRCPMLHVSPKMISRLDDLEADLITRRARAQAEGWAGEIEGLDLTFQLLRAKRDDTHRRTQRPTVDLGIPTPRRTKKDQ